nr:signal peptide, CUB and EGF-like protein domain-containing protein 2 [Pomacea canaliculata]
MFTPLSIPFIIIVIILYPKFFMVGKHDSAKLSLHVHSFYLQLSHPTTPVKVMAVNVCAIPVVQVPEVRGHLSDTSCPKPLSPCLIGCVCVGGGVFVGERVPFSQ